MHEIKIGYSFTPRDHLCLYIHVFFFQLFRHFYQNLRQLLSNTHTIPVSCLFHFSLCHEHLIKDSNMLNHCIIVHLPVNKKFISLSLYC